MGKLISSDTIYQELSEKFILMAKNIRRYTEELHKIGNCHISKKLFTIS